MVWPVKPSVKGWCLSTDLQRYLGKWLSCLDYQCLQILRKKSAWCGRDSSEVGSSSPCQEFACLWGAREAQEGRLRTLVPWSGLLFTYCDENRLKWAKAEGEISQEITKMELVDALNWVVIASEFRGQGVIRLSGCREIKGVLLRSEPSTDNVWGPLCSYII